MFILLNFKYFMLSYWALNYIPSLSFSKSYCLFYIPFSVPAVYSFGLKLEKTARSIISPICHIQSYRIAMSEDIA